MKLVETFSLEIKSLSPSRKSKQPLALELSDNLEVATKSLIEYTQPKATAAS